jgi:hypothetical protein
LVTCETFGRPLDNASVPMDAHQAFADHIERGTIS